MMNFQEQIIPTSKLSFGAHWNSLIDHDLNFSDPVFAVLCTYGLKNSMPFIVRTNCICVSYDS